MSDFLDGNNIRPEGYESAWDDGFTVGHADGYATGYAAGLVAALAEVRERVLRADAPRVGPERPNGELHGED